MAVIITCSLLEGGFSCYGGRWRPTFNSWVCCFYTVVCYRVGRATMPMQQARIARTEAPCSIWPPGSADCCNCHAAATYAYRASRRRWHGRLPASGGVRLLVAGFNTTQWEKAGWYQGQLLAAAAAFHFYVARLCTHRQWSYFVMGARSRRVPPQLLLTSATMCRVQVCYAMAGLCSAGITGRRRT